MNVLARTCLVAALALTGLAGCGEIRNPFEKEKPFVRTAVPADFAVAVDEANDSYYARQDIRQVVTAQDMMSRTTLTTRRDYNNAVAEQYPTERPVSQAQLQAMWDQVTKYQLMQGAKTWYYWQSFTDDYNRTERRIQIRANGQLREYKQLNHWGYKLRDLALLVEAVRFPVAGGDGSTPAVSGGAAPAPRAVAVPTTAAPVTPRRAVATQPVTEPPDLPNIPGTQPAR